MHRFTNGWYVLYTRYRQEKKVEDQLLENNVGVFLPRVQKLRTWADRKKVVTEAMFPSYLFVRLSGTEEYYSSLSFEGVLKYVKFGNEMARVSDEVIGSLRIVSERNISVHISESSFLPGRKIMIKAGPFAGIRGEIVKWNGGEKMLIRIDVLMRQVLADICLSDIMEDEFRYSADFSS
jgi:transcriptional antiterminator RfaH